MLDGSSGAFISLSILSQAALAYAFKWDWKLPG